MRARFKKRRLVRKRGVINEKTAVSKRECLLTAVLIYLMQIFELKQKGYTNLQVSDWLASNGMHVSSEAVRKFIKTREGKEENTAPPGFGHDQETKPDSQKQTTQKGKAGSFEIPIPKKFVHNNRPDDDQLK